jgi:hypothetical protein|tara:strand:- start:544 stop:1800 length:1257 start_codon:yes stop_codon:yes gene_type:complete
MIETLKKLTLKNAGFELKGRGDCEVLSHLILEKTDEFISYNTLRRMFGLVAYVKPSINTLNTLARFNGYKNYVDFIKITPSLVYWTEKEKLYQNISKNQHDILEYIQSNDFTNESKLDFVISFCRELIYTKKTSLLKEFFQSTFFTNNQFTYSEILHFGNSIGRLLMDYPEIGAEILQYPNFLNFVYCIYVDYNNINGYYGDWNQLVLEKSKELHLTAFSESIYQLKNYLNGNEVTYENLNELDKSTLHPILIGRIYSIKIITSGYRFEDLNQLILKHYKPDDNKILYDLFYEPIFIALMTKNFQLMKDIIKILSSHKMTFEYYHEEHRNNFELMSLIYQQSISNNSPKKPKQILSKVARDHKYSYRYVITLFELILSYHLGNKNEQKMLVNQFNERALTLNYPLFTENYLLNYFQEN